MVNFLAERATQGEARQVTTERKLDIILDMERNEALISPVMLVWARKRVGLNAENLASKLNVGTDRYAKWETGEKRPTFRQAEQIAEKLYIPFGFLYLTEPPKRSAALPDMRTVDNRMHDGYSPELQDLLRDVVGKQGWLRETREEQGVPSLPFIGKYQHNANAQKMAEEILDAIEQLPNKKNGFLTELVHKIEAMGVCVMRSGVVNGNNNRPLDVEEFRGFAFSDDLAPIIFINSQDSPNAQNFTLIHELAHLYLGESGVSDVYLSDEQLCNHVAAMVLVDEFVFRQELADCENEAAILNRLPSLCSQFAVSESVLAIRAKKLGLISSETEHMRQTKERKAKKSGGGGDYYRTRIAAVSRNFAKEVLNLLDADEILIRDAALLLGINYSNLDKFRMALED